jgi:cardiolipin synthase C
MSVLASFGAVLALVGGALCLSGCATLPPPVAGVPSYAMAEVSDTPLARITAAAQPAHLPAASGFRLLPEAAFAFDARAALVQHARKSLDVQYYLIQQDDIGLQLLGELRDAAARGVRVRLLIDDLHTGGEDELFATLAAHPNVEVRLFNPLPSRARSVAARVLLSLHEFGRINHRMHNKLLVADNSCAVSGGRNIANEYFMRSTAANFIDMDLLSCGPVVREMSAAFDRYWNSAQVRPVGDVVQLALAPEAARLRFDALVREARPDVPLRAADVMGSTAVGRQIDAGAITLRWAPARLFHDDPSKLERASGEAAYRGSVNEGAHATLNAARKGVVIVSPYFIPGDRGMTMMATARRRGGHIVVVTNSLGATDEPLAYAGYTRYRADMLKMGVLIQEIAPDLGRQPARFGDFGASTSRLHAKLAVIDDDRMFIGSMNLDYRSSAVNTEMGVAIDSPELVADFNRLMAGRPINFAYRLRLAPDGERVQWLEEDATGADIVHDDEPGGHYWRRIRNWLLSPWVDEQLL